MNLKLQKTKFLILNLSTNFKINLRKVYIFMLKKRIESITPNIILVFAITTIANRKNKF